MHATSLKRDRNRRHQKHSNDGREEWVRERERNMAAIIDNEHERKSTIHHIWPSNKQPKPTTEWIDINDKILTNKITHSEFFRLLETQCLCTLVNKVMWMALSGYRKNLPKRLSQMLQRSKRNYGRWCQIHTQTHCHTIWYKFAWDHCAIV